MIPIIQTPASSWHQPRQFQLPPGSGRNLLFSGSSHGPTPERGLEHLSHIFHRAFRNNLCRGKFKKARRPVLLNSWEGVYFDFNGEKTGADGQGTPLPWALKLFVMDDGWFGKRDKDVSGLGDWVVNEKKLGCTLGELSDQIHALGMQFWHLV